MAGAQKRVKTVFLGVLLTAALALPLSAQDLSAPPLPAQDLSAPPLPAQDLLAPPLPAQDFPVPALPAQDLFEGEWIFVSYATGGTEEERAYFDSRLPDAVMANGWTLSNTMEESDLFITADIAYNYELRLQAITVQLHDSVTGEQIASNAMGYAIVTDMDEWNNLLIEELMEGIEKYGHFDRGFGAGAEIVYSSELTLSERLWGREQYWLHLAPRVGGALRFYSPMQGANTVGGSFDIGVQALVQALPFLGIQAELLYTTDTAPQFNITDNLNAINAKSAASSLMVPVVVMVTFRPDEWLIGPFVGPYINIPLGQMKTADGDSDYSWGAAGFGWTAGIEVGRKLGPGTLFADIRYIGDFGDMAAKNGLVRNRRTGVSLSLGYSLALFKKNSGGGW